MANILKSTFFSFDALKSETSNIKNFLLLMNVKRNASCQKLRKVQIYDPIIRILFMNYLQERILFPFMNYLLKTINQLKGKFF